MPDWSAGSSTLAIRLACDAPHSSSSDKSSPAGLHPGRNTAPPIRFVPDTGDDEGESGRVRLQQIAEVVDGMLRTSLLEYASLLISEGSSEQEVWIALSAATENCQLASTLVSSLREPDCARGPLSPAPAPTGSAEPDQLQASVDILSRLSSMSPLGGSAAAALVPFINRASMAKADAQFEAITAAHLPLQDFVRASLSAGRDSFVAPIPGGSPPCARFDIAIDPAMYPGGAQDVLRAIAAQDAAQDAAAAAAAAAKPCPRPPPLCFDAMEEPEGSSESSPPGSPPTPSSGKGGRPKAGVGRVRAHSGSGSGREISLEALREMFHLTIEDAAQHLGVGVTVMKKYCRKFRVDRWPYRMISSLDKLVQNVEELRGAANPADRATLERALTVLAQLRVSMSLNPSRVLPDIVKKTRQLFFKNEHNKRRQAPGTPTPAATATAALLAAKLSPYLAPAYLASIGCPPAGA